MRPVVQMAVLVLLIGAVVPPIAASSAAAPVTGRPVPEVPRAQVPEQRQYTLPPGHYYYFSIQSYGGGTKLKFSVGATVQVDVYVMNAAQFSGFTSQGTNSAIYHATSASLSQEVALQSAGTYYLVIDNDVSGIYASLSVAYNTVPVDVYQLISSAPAPTGIADYGVLNESGYMSPYSRAMTSVTGSAVISALQAYNATSPTGSSPYGASLQVNVMLRVNTTTGQHVYWLQNVLSLYTNNQTAYFLDNIWNASLPSGILDPVAIGGRGGVYIVGDVNYYVDATNIFTYSLPLSVKMPISVSHSGDDVMVTFGYQKGSGGSPPGATDAYDTVTILETGLVTDAAMVVSGRSMTPAGTYFDAELVFGGQCCSAVTTFTKMDATLSLSYLLANGDVASPSSVYQFGSDTAEGAFGARTDLVQNKFQVGLGTLGFSPYSLVAPTPVTITVSYSVSDNSQMVSPPTLNYVANGTDLTVPIGGAPTTFKADAGTLWEVTPTIQGLPGERWSAPDGTSGAATSDATVALTYYHQYQVTGSYSLRGGGNPSPPVIQATSYGAGVTVALGDTAGTYWLDSGTAWSVPASLGGSTGAHRWQTPSATSGTIGGPVTLSPAYFEQDLLTVGLRVAGGGAPAVSLNFTSFGAPSSSAVGRNGSAVWVDDGTSYSAPPLAAGSNPAERWVSNSTLGGRVTGPVTASLVYRHQFFVTVASSAPSGTTVTPDSGWFDSGAAVSLGANATSLWKFTGWAGGGQGAYSGGQVAPTVTVDGPVNETALFDPGIRLTAGQGGSVSYVVGAETGTVSAGTPAVLYAPAGTSVTLTSQPSLFLALSRWTGAVNGSQPALTMTLQTPSQEAATFGVDYAQVGGVAALLVILLAAAALVARRRHR